MPQALFVLEAFCYILHKYHHSYSEHDKEAKIQGGKQSAKTKRNPFGWIFNRVSLFVYPCARFLAVRTIFHHPTPRRTLFTYLKYPARRRDFFFAFRRTSRTAMGEQKIPCSDLIRAFRTKRTRPFGNRLSFFGFERTPFRASRLVERTFLRRRVFRCSRV